MSEWWRPVDKAEERRALLGAQANDNAASWDASAREPITPTRASSKHYRIVAVGLGNICRSPMAAAVLTARFSETGLGHNVSVTSASTGGWHIGKSADPRARATLQRAGFQSDHRARQFESSWFSEADLILGMDYSNVQDLRGMAPNDYSASRVLIMRSFDPSLMHLPEDDPALAIPDPYYGTEMDFRTALTMIERSANGIVDQVRLELARADRPPRRTGPTFDR